MSDKAIESTVDYVLRSPECYSRILKKARETFNYECSNCELPIPDAMIDLEYREARKIEREEIEHGNLEKETEG